jgi:septal ring factor EnvC (AmiA/AmiB activator)
LRYRGRRGGFDKYRENWDSAARDWPSRMMKNFLQNLLIFFALCLCGLIAFQWVRETDLRKEIQKLNDTVHDKSQAIIDLEARLRHDEEEIKRLDGLKNELTATVKSNNLEIARLGKDLEKANVENQRKDKQIEVYKEAINTANENIKKQNEEMKAQNEEMKKLAEDRNEVVKKFNQMAGEYKDLVEKWNKQQDEIAARNATNAPPKK